MGNIGDSMGHEGQRLTNWIEEIVRGSGGRVSFDVTHYKESHELQFSISIYPDRFSSNAIKIESMIISEELMPYMRDNAGIIEELIKRFQSDITRTG